MKTRAKTLLCSLLPALFLFNTAAAPVSTAPVDLDLTARAAVLMEAETGRVLYAKNPSEQMAPASLVKIMTILVAMEEKDLGRVDWDTRITASRRAWKTSEGGKTSTMFLNVNQQANFEEMIKGIAVVSANDACVAVAEHLYGSEEAFVQQMNRRAAELDLKNTHFINAHGLDHPDQYVSALDMARLSAYLYKTQPEAAAFLSEGSFTFNDIIQYNFNPLLGSYPGADGVKTGSTVKAGMSLAGSAAREGMRLISVVLNTPGREERGRDSETLLNYGFNNYELTTLHAAGEIAAYAPVNRGREEEVGLVPEKKVRAVVPRGETDYVTEHLNLDSSLEAPVEKGDPAGKLQILDPDGEIQGEYALYAGENVDRLGFFRSLFRSIGEFFKNLWSQGRGD